MRQNAFLNRNSLRFVAAVLCWKVAIKRGLGKLTAANDFDDVIAQCWVYRGGHIDPVIDHEGRNRGLPGTCPGHGEKSSDSGASAVTADCSHCNMQPGNCSCLSDSFCQSEPVLRLVRTVFSVSEDFGDMETTQCGPAQTAKPHLRSIWVFRAMNHGNPASARLKEVLEIAELPPP